jgi:hypothetical protein
MDLCVFDFILFFNYLDGSGSNECAYCSNSSKHDFYYFYGHANFCLFTLYFQYPSAFGNFLHHASQLKYVSNLVQYVPTSIQI